MYHRSKANYWFRIGLTLVVLGFGVAMAVTIIPEFMDLCQGVQTQLQVAAGN